VISHSKPQLGRGLHKNSLHLPSPRLFDHSARKKELNKGSRDQTEDSAPDEQRRWSQLPYLSDSDGEEGVLEADRDARLAYVDQTAFPLRVISHRSVRQSRVLTPSGTSMLDPEEQSMSSGDESDNEDLTDAETSDSDWFDTSKLV